MNFSAIFRIVLVFCLPLALTANAQQSPAGSGIISGKLVDGSNNQPLPFATVALVSKPDNKVIKGLQTDVNGDF
ncbi:MAG: hypothetical protein JWR54_2742, partial [Mucilaginibacter sp.]|nr:hypothetical protein [Mucilaginibacter sp.]